MATSTSASLVTKTTGSSFGPIVFCKGADYIGCTTPDKIFFLGWSPDTKYWENLPSLDFIPEKFEDVRCWCTHKGLLCVEIVSCMSFTHRLYVCNPLIQTYVSIPTPPTKTSREENKDKEALVLIAGESGSGFRMFAFAPGMSIWKLESKNLALGWQILLLPSTIAHSVTGIHKPILVNGTIYYLTINDLRTQLEDYNLVSYNVQEETWQEDPMISLKGKHLKTTAWQLINLNDELWLVWMKPAEYSEDMPIVIGNENPGEKEDFSQLEKFEIHIMKYDMGASMFYEIYTTTRSAFHFSHDHFCVASGKNELCFLFYSQKQDSRYGSELQLEMFNVYSLQWQGYGTSGIFAYDYFHNNRTAGRTFQLTHVEL